MSRSVEGGGKKLPVFFASVEKKENLGKVLLRAAVLVGWEGKTDVAKKKLRGKRRVSGLCKENFKATLTIHLQFILEAVFVFLKKNKTLLGAATF